MVAGYSYLQYLETRDWHLVSLGAVVVVKHSHLDFYYLVPALVSLQQGLHAQLCLAVGSLHSCRWSSGPMPGPLVPLRQWQLVRLLPEARLLQLRLVELSLWRLQQPSARPHQCETDRQDSLSVA